MKETIQISKQLAYLLVLLQLCSCSGAGAGWHDHNAQTAQSPANTEPVVPPTEPSMDQALDTDLMPDKFEIPDEAGGSALPPVKQSTTGSAQMSRISTVDFARPIESVNAGFEFNPEFPDVPFFTMGVDDGPASSYAIYQFEAISLLETPVALNMSSYDHFEQNPVVYVGWADYASRRWLLKPYNPAASDETYSLRDLGPAVDILGPERRIRVAVLSLGQLRLRPAILSIELQQPFPVVEGLHASHGKYASTIELAWVHPAELSSYVANGLCYYSVERRSAAGNDDSWQVLYYIDYKESKAVSQLDGWEAVAGADPVQPEAHYLYRVRVCMDAENVHFTTTPVSGPASAEVEGWTGLPPVTALSRKERGPEDWELNWDSESGLDYELQSQRVQNLPGGGPTVYHAWEDLADHGEILEGKFHPDLASRTRWKQYGDSQMRFRIRYHHVAGSKDAPWRVSALMD